MLKQEVPYNLDSIPWHGRNYLKPGRVCSVVRILVGYGLLVHGYLSELGSSMV